MPAKKKEGSRLGIWPFGSALGLREEGGWVSALKSHLDSCTPNSQQHWEGLVRLAAEARPRAGGKWSETQTTSELQCGPEYGFGLPHPEPGTEAYHEELLRSAPGDDLVERIRDFSRAIGETDYASTLSTLYQSAIQSPVGLLNRNAPNREILRALIWFVLPTPIPEMIHALSHLAAWSVEKNTAQAKTIGIALAATLSEHGAAALRMIQMSAKRQTPKDRFDRLACHVERKLGISADESAERFVPSFGLNEQGLARKQFGESGAAEVAIVGSKTVMCYFNATGKQVASPPASVKRDNDRELRELRASAKGLDQQLKTQKTRIEAMLGLTRCWPLPTWRNRYLEHPIVGTLARRLI